MSESISISNFTDYMNNDGKILGVMIGVVIKNDSANDSEKPGPGLVKVKIPLLGMKESNWARLASFMAGKERGAFFLPEVEDEVLVAFENGDANKPFIIGALWNGKDAPPDTNSDGKNNIRMIKSRSGHIIQLFDKKDEEKILIQSAKGQILEMNDKNGSFSIIDNSGKNKIVISTKDNKVTITSEKDIELAAPKGKISMSAQNIEIKSSADTKMEASAGMDIKASANMTIKGATVNIN